MELGDRILVMAEGRITRSLEKIDDDASLGALLQTDAARQPSYATRKERHDHGDRACGHRSLRQLCPRSHHLRHLRPHHLLLHCVCAPFCFVRDRGRGVAHHRNRAVMAIGMTFVIVCGEIDLSIGSLASFAGMIVAMLYERDVPTFVAPLIVLVMGAFIGAVSGLLVTKIRIPSFL